MNSYHNILPPYADAEQSELATAAQRGDDAAQDKLVFSFLPLIIHICGRHGVHGSHQDQENYVHAGIEGLHIAIQRYRAERGRFVNYACYYIHNRISNSIRQEIMHGIHGRQKIIPQMIEISERIHGQPDTTPAINRDELAAASQCLSEIERTVIQLRYYDEKKYREIAAELGCSISRCQQIHEKAIKKLKRAIREKS
jgi:RNA polymerase sigma factor (sigma-70 family)